MDPRLSLALSMQSNPGVYALLLGSGVSRAAEVPTGWEVVLDLIERVATMRDDEVDGDPVEWYRETFGEDPEYSDLLERLAALPAERQQILKGYFEPTDEEREQGIKQPTEAHKAIAALCRDGYVRVVLTTNFDRLLEQALRAEGVEPTVLASKDAIAGAPPLVHTDLLVVKLHGDYLDLRIRNTTAELAEYPPEIDAFLDRILDEFGLIVCGWSARYDPALRGAIERAKSRRYTTYWTGLSEPDESLEDLLKLRGAQFIEIEGANRFFTELRDRVLALEEHARPHPLSVEAAVAAVKRHISEGRDIRLHDLIAGETERVLRRLTEEHFPAQNTPFSDELLFERVRQCEGLTEILRAAVAVGCFWGEPRHQRTWTYSVERLAKPADSNPARQVWQRLRRFPGTLVLYTAGVAALAAGRWGNLRALLLDSEVIKRERGKREPAIRLLQKWAAIERDVGRRLPDMERRHTPVSDRIHEVIRHSLRVLIPDQDRYDDLFDRFEYLLALVYGDLTDGHWGPLGRFHWRYQHSGSSPVDYLNSAVEKRGDEAEFLQAGFFSGNVGRFVDVRDAFNEWRSGVHWI